MARTQLRFDHIKRLEVPFLASSAKPVTQPKGCQWRDALKVLLSISEASIWVTEPNAKRRNYLEATLQMIAKNLGLHVKVRPQNALIYSWRTEVRTLWSADVTLKSFPPPIAVLETTTERNHARIRLRGFWVYRCWFVACLAAIVSGCTANGNPLIGTPAAGGETAGFLLGWWHGFIMPYAFVVSLFSDNTSIYEVHNSGGWYNFGYYLGIAAFFGGGSSAAVRGSKARRRQD